MTMTLEKKAMRSERSKYVQYSHFQSHKEPRLNSAFAFKCNIVFDEMTTKSCTMVYKDLLVCTKNGTNQQWICMKINTGAESNILPLREFK